jgi:hypothetical protein
MRITEELKRQVRRELASRGGKARAEKYGKKTLSKWAKLGGRPPKPEKGAKRNGNGRGSRSNRER